MRFVTASVRQPQILLVESDEMLLEVWIEALKRQRYSFTIARTGDEAVRMAYELTPRVVLLDIDLPGQSGFLVAAKLKVVKPSPRVLFLTAMPRGVCDRVAAFLRVDGVLHKPFPVRKLLGTVDGLLGLAKAA